MSWIELNLDTTNEAVDWVYTLLAKAIAAQDIHISEYSEQQENHKWTFSIQMYLPEDARIHQRIDEIEKILIPLQRTGMTSKLQTFVVPHKPSPLTSSQNPSNSLIRRIGDRFVILSTDSDYQPHNDQEILIHLQTSLAFGSGLHPATILSLRLLERYVQPNLYTLDLGSGSGILSLAMAKLGAEVLAIDNDPIAVSATQKAVTHNQVQQQVTVIEASLGSASQLGHWMGSDSLAPVTAIIPNEQFDLIVANIFARVHIALAPEFYQALRSTSHHAGMLITAGYTSDRAEDVTSAMAEVGFHLYDQLQINEWIAIAFRKSPT